MNNTEEARTVVYAPNMLVAQGYRMTNEVRAKLTAKADRFRQITGTTEPTRMTLAVNDGSGAVIGHMNFML